MRSPQWLLEHGGAVVGRHHMILPKYDYDELVSVVTDHLETCEADDWQAVALKVGRLGTGSSRITRTNPAAGRHGSLLEGFAEGLEAELRKG